MHIHAETKFDVKKESFVQKIATFTPKNASEQNRLTFTECILWIHNALIHSTWQLAIERRKDEQA